MARTMCILAWLLAAPTVLLAQTDASYDGLWTIRHDSKENQFSGMQKTDAEGRMVVAGKTGTWQMGNRKRKDPCSGLEAPISVLKATRKVLVIKALLSQALRGCGDFKVTFRPVDANSLDGKHNDGRKVTATRN